MAPFKRVRQPKMTTQALLDFDLGESSSDSDFRIEDHANDEDEQDDSGDEGNSTDNSTEDEDASDSDESDEGGGSNDSTQQLKQLLAGDVELQTNGGDGGGCVVGDDLERMLRQLDSKKEQDAKVPTKPICCVCLGDRSDDSNEIIECDGCGVSVHEGCYGVSDNASISSTNSTCSTEPWFCEACRAGVSEPTCELCPNKGGIYKETDVGKWVHLICALYVPGVAFGEVDQLSSVTLFEMPYNKWGAKVCSLCESSRFARTGVCIGCDAGMCKTYFHVTCAQAAGFLTEAHHDEAEAADPFYAHCKVHSEKEMIKKRKRNFHTFRLNMQQKQKEKLTLKLEDPCPAQLRIHRKLLKYQRKYTTHKQLKATPWVPTQKMSRLLTTSASACKRLLAKADIMAVDVELLERQEAQIAALTDIRKKWHIAPAFSVEFIGYYLDRISRTKELKQQLSEMMDSNASLSKEQDTLRKDYDAHLDSNKALKEQQDKLLSTIMHMHKQITTLCPSKNLPNPSNIGRAHNEPTKTATPPSRPISVPTAAALKMGVGFPLAHLGPPGTKVDSTRLLSTHAKNSPTAVATTGTASTASVSSAPTTPTTLGVQTFDCGICKRCNDQHLLAKCDTCKLHYHLGCLNPPLTRHPKKSKLYGWQCSECDKSDESDAMAELPKGPRKSRTRFNKDGLIVPVKAGDKSMHADQHNPLSPTQVLPTKRRSTDAVTPTAVAQRASSVASKRNLNRSLPTDVCSSVEKMQSDIQKSGSPSVIAKRSKLSLSYVPLHDINEKPQTPTKLSTTAKKAPQPIHANLLSDQPLVLVIPQNPMPATIDLTEPDMDQEPEANPDPLALPDRTVAFAASSPLDDSSDPSKQARKQKRKDKHRSKHNLSSDTEKSPNKEHKRKRKKKPHEHHDAANPNDSTGSAGIPKIKIKFKTLPLPGEVTPEAQFFYVPADMVRSAEEASRPTSVETVEDVTASEDANASKITAGSSTASPTKSPKLTTPTRKSSPRKAHQRNAAGGRAKLNATTQPVQNYNCCVCQQSGTSTNVVTCDECRKHYHFTCLDPPLKKTPKIRGYSWHCADCDPTDEELK